MKIYIKKCQKCKEQTENIISLTSRKRGVKLQCLSCGLINSRYEKFNTLQEKLQ